MAALVAYTGNVWRSSLSIWRNGVAWRNGGNDGVTASGVAYATLA